MWNDIIHVPYHFGLEMHKITRCTTYFDKEITYFKKITVSVCVRLTVSFKLRSFCLSLMHFAHFYDNWVTPQIDIGKFGTAFLTQIDFSIDCKCHMANFLPFHCLEDTIHLMTFVVCISDHKRRRSWAKQWKNTSCWLLELLLGFMHSLMDISGLF